MFKQYSYYCALILILGQGILFSKSKFLLLLGPSGTGKSTIIKHLKALDSRFKYVTPMTTRPLREGEYDKVHVSLEEMDKLNAEGKLLTINNIYGIYYATPKNLIDTALNQHEFPVLDWPVQKIDVMQSNYPGELFVVYVAPDNVDELLRRLALDNRDADGKRSALGKEEMQAFLAGSFDSLIDLKITNQKDCSEQVAQLIYHKYIAATKD